MSSGTQRAFQSRMLDSPLNSSTLARLLRTSMALAVLCLVGCVAETDQLAEDKLFENPDAQYTIVEAAVEWGWIHVPDEPIELSGGQIATVVSLKTPEIISGYRGHGYLGVPIELGNAGRIDVRVAPVDVTGLRSNRWPQVFLLAADEHGVPHGDVVEGHHAPYDSNHDRARYASATVEPGHYTIVISDINRVDDYSVVLSIEHQPGVPPCDVDGDEACRSVESCFADPAFAGGASVCRVPSNRPGD